MPISLEQVHRGQVHRRIGTWQSVGDELAADRLAEDFGRAILAREMVVRAVGLRDRTFEQRIARILAWAPDADSLVFKENHWRYLARSWREVDAFVVHGTDLARLVRIVRSIREVYAAIPIVVVCDAAVERATDRLLGAGADDVLGPSVRSPVAAARLRAHSRRVQFSTVHRRQAAPGIAHDSLEVAAGGRLSPAEGDILRVLMAAGGRDVSYSQLLRGGRRCVTGETKRTLQVQIHHLRKKLNGRWTIENIRRSGYRLVPLDGFGLVAPPSDRSSGEARIASHQNGASACGAVEIAT